MLNNAMRLGFGNDWGIDFNSNHDGKLKVKGLIVQSMSGDEQPIGVYRGVYDSSATYYSGDEVSYTVGNST